MICRAGFTGEGYLTLAGQSLRKRANIAFVFRTLQSECLLLLAGYPFKISQHHMNEANVEIFGNFSMALLDGHLEVWISSGRGFLRLVSKMALNDGKYHVVHVIKNGRKFDLIVDDDMQDTQTLMGTVTLINILEEDGGRLYLGGLPSLKVFNGITPTFVKLEGAIRDVVINNSTINLNQALETFKVQIGRDGPEMGGTANGFIDVPLKTQPMIGSKSLVSEAKPTCETVSCKPNINENEAITL